MTKHPASNSRRSQRGSSAVEFALAMPILLALIGGVADFGIAFYDKSALANSVSQAAQYVALTPSSSVAPATMVTTAKAIAAHDLGLDPTAVTARSLGCGCPSTSASAQQTIISAACGNTCSGGTSSVKYTAAEYMYISAQYTYVPIMPFYSRMVTSPVLQASTTVRLQK